MPWPAPLYLQAGAFTAATPLLRKPSGLRWKVSFAHRGSCKEWRTFGLDGVELDGKAMDSLARQAVDVEWVDYREPRWVEGDSDPRQMPIIGRWPRHEAFFL